MSLRAQLGPGGADRRLHVLLLLGRRQDGGHAQRLDPELPGPAGRVVEVLVLLLLDLLVGFLQRRALLALRLLGELADQLPVQVVLGLGEHDALGGHDLRRLGLAALEGHLHRLHQRLADVPDDQSPGRLRLRIELEPREDVLHDLARGSASARGTPPTPS